MSTVEIARRRLAGQRVSARPLGSVAEVVGWLGAMQAQEYPAAKWAIAQRTDGLTDDELDRAFDDGVFLRTHVLRPTWHFVLPADIRWLLALTGPRVHAANAHYYRKLGVDHDVHAVATKVLTGALAGGNRLTRTEVGAALAAAGIEATGLRLGYILMRAELDALICSGPLAGRQHTYALLDERAPPARELTRDEALAELTGRYFTSRGPATVKDFVRWSGLTQSDGRHGLELAGDRLHAEEIDGLTYWSGAAGAPPEPEVSPTFHLIQGYDEYVMGYSETRGALDVFGVAAEPRGDGAFLHAILLDTQVVGFWRRQGTARSVTVETDLLVPLDDARRRALDDAVRSYGEFLGVPTTWV